MNNVMRYRYRPLYSLVILLLTAPSQYVWSQNQVLSRLQQQVETYRTQTLQEKLFVHTDRSFYMTGELLWFRLFYVDGSLHRPLDVSKVAYLELLDKDQKAVLQTKVPLDTGKGAGSLLLPTSLVSGQYVLRAYSYWMKMTSPDFLFEKTITIVNPFRKLNLATAIDSLAYEVQLFPEGGNLVSELPAKVAFKVVDPKTGQGVDCQGTLVNQTNDTVARFTSLKFGMGTFSFIPSVHTTYRVLLKDRRGRRFSQKLPVIYESGYTMQAEEIDANQLKITVRTNKSMGDAGSAVYLIGHTRQSVKIADMQLLQGNQATFLLPKNRLGEGISHLTVFDAAAQPVCERLYCKRPQPSLTIQVKSDKEQYATRSPVSLDVTTNLPSGAGIPTDVSISVYRIDSLQTGEGMTLPDYLWLTSDLRGTIESPGYYLTHTDSEANAALDNLMLTHGWRRFRWESVQQPKPVAVNPVPEHRGLLIRGRVTDISTGTPARNVLTYLSVPGKAFQLASRRSDEQGLVQFELTDFYGTKDIVLQTTVPDSIHRVDILNPYTETAAATRLPIFELTPSLSDPLSTRSLAMQVQNSYYNQYAAPPIPIRKDSTAFYGKPDEHYILDAYTRFTVLEEVLSEYVPGVSVRRRNKHFQLRVNNVPYLAFFEDEPLILLDGVPVFDTDRIMALSPLAIKTLDVVTRRYFLGYISLPGIIHFRTYKGDLAGVQIDPHAVVLEYDGLQAQREFYTPQYATPKQVENRLPDFRNLLYWNPTLTTNQQGKAGISFYTSDQEGNYLVVMQGMTPDGHFSSTQHTITVRGRLKL